MQAALHAATTTLPHLRKGLTARNAERAVPHGDTAMSMPCGTHSRNVGAAP